MSIDFQAHRVDAMTRSTVTASRDATVVLTQTPVIGELSGDDLGGDQRYGSELGMR